VNQADASTSGTNSQVDPSKSLSQLKNSGQIGNFLYSSMPPPPPSFSPASQVSPSPKQSIASSVCHKPYGISSNPFPGNFSSDAGRLQGNVTTRPPISQTRENKPLQPAILNPHHQPILTQRLFTNDSVVANRRDLDETSDNGTEYFSLSSSANKFLYLFEFFLHSSVCLFLLR